jgi:ribonucleoside-diphosphate reductase alpha chain
MTTLRDRFEAEFGDEQMRREDLLAFIEKEREDATSKASHVVRERLFIDRKSITRDFVIPCPGHPQGDFRMHVTVGLYPDGRPGEIFIWADKAGSLASGALMAVAITLSFQWQHGIPFEGSVNKLRGMRFEPQGATGDVKYPLVSSPLDYVARWLLDKFGKLAESRLPRCL